MNHNLELLTSIIISTKSQNNVVAPKTSSSLKFDKRTIDKTSTEFAYELYNSSDQNSNYSFKVIINRIPNFYFFKNMNDDGSRYVATIIVRYRHSRYSSWEDKDEYLFDSTECYGIELKDLYKFLMDGYTKDLDTKKNEKINTYLKEARKLHSKDVVRDEKLDKLLS